jgi:hypothetical protein
MKTKITHHSKILNLLQDRKWHCGLAINRLEIKDDRKRISELNHSGYLILGEPCDIHIHDSRIFMRKLVRKFKSLTSK